MDYFYFYFEYCNLVGYILVWVWENFKEGINFLLDVYCLVIVVEENFGFWLDIDDILMLKMEFCYFFVG